MSPRMAAAMIRIWLAVSDRVASSRSNILAFPYLPRGLCRRVVMSGHDLSGGHCHCQPADWQATNARRAKGPSALAGADRLAPLLCVGPGGEPLAHWLIANGDDERVVT